MLMVNEAGLNLIKAFEGFAETPYLDAAGLPTIGYGHLIKPEERFDVVSRAEAENMLQIDIQVAAKAVGRLINVPLTENQFAALVSFTFNLGSAALQRSTLRQCVNREEHEDAAQEFMRWVWVGGRKLKGLIFRRRAEVELYLTE